MLIAEDIQVEWDEGGCYLMVDGERWRVADPEQLYDRVKSAILPWLMERDEALREYRARLALSLDAARDAEDVSGGLDEHWHSVRADLYDTYRPGK